ncbi:hypothetical protein OK074_0446 [Actinobacteria bacterium OK074]|nr:hypothetical protein OK074_0446 [Actinobacteria bacterium OK074]
MPDPEPAGPTTGTDFERILDQALDTEQVRESLARTAGAPDRARLRARALAARAAITAAAAVEYRDYTAARAAATDRRARCDEAAGASAGAHGEGRLLPLLAVLVTSQSAVAAAVFLLSGFALSSLGGRPYIGGGLITAGLIAAAVAIGAVVGDRAWLLTAAAHDRSADDTAPASGDDPEVAKAWEAWELALLERGMVPYLLGRLEESRLSERGGRSEP